VESGQVVVSPTVRLDYSSVLSPNVDMRQLHPAATGQ
jgi:hypothetical protein